MQSTRVSPSFDITSMEPDELVRFHRLASMSTPGYAAQLFPTKPAGYQEATATLGSLAWWRYREITATDAAARANARAMWEFGVSLLPSYARWE